MSTHLYNHSFGPAQQPGLGAVVSRARRRSLVVVQSFAAVVFVALMLVLLAAAR